MKRSSVSISKVGAALVVGPRLPCVRTAASHPLSPQELKLLGACWILHPHTPVRHDCSRPPR